MRFRHARRLPPLPEPFPAPFRAMLDGLLARSARITGARREVARSRHRALEQTGTFVGHRPYAPGDDLRRIDWNAYARTGSLFVKLLAEDERRATTVWLDLSASMRAGQPPRLLTALRLAAILAGLALRHLDGVELCAGGQETFAGRGSVPQLLEHLGALGRAHDPTTAGPGADPGDVAVLLRRRRAPGKVHWISDFTGPAATERALRRLRRGGFQVVGWLPTIPDDFAVEPCGWRTVVDPETGAESALRLDRELAAAMTHELQVLAQQQQQVFANCGFPLQRVTLPTDAFEAARWLEAGWSFRR
ncbi:MAG: DUF58 domain-containing protein [Planctomycetota bacterium]